MGSASTPRTARRRPLLSQGVGGYLNGPSRRTARLNEALALNPTTVNLLVTTKFAPEEFHIQLYQKIGSMRGRGVNGHTAKLYGVSPFHVRQLSRYYWIEQIDLDV